MNYDSPGDDQGVSNEDKCNSMCKRYAIAKYYYIE